MNAVGDDSAAAEENGDDDEEDWFACDEAAEAFDRWNPSQFSLQISVLSFRREITCNLYPFLY